MKVARDLLGHVCRKMRERFALDQSDAHSGLHPVRRLEVERGCHDGGWLGITIGQQPRLGRLPHLDQLRHQGREIPRQNRSRPPPLDDGPTAWAFLDHVIGMQRIQRAADGDPRHLEFLRQALLSW